MRSRTALGALIGVLCAAVAVGVGEATAAFVRAAAAPVIAVGNRLITLTPGSAKRAAIDSVGTNDKPLLLLGIYVFLALFGALIGVLAVRRLAFGLAGIAAFAGFGAYCAITAPAGRGSDVLPTLVGAGAAMLAMTMLVRTVRAERGDPAEPATASPTGADRRAFLYGSLATAGLAAAAGFGGRLAQHARFDVRAERAALMLPPASTGEHAVPAGADLGASGVPWVTPNNQFYRVDTALSVPQIDWRSWSLRIHGLVDKPLTLTYRDVLARPLVERWVTLSCVSNLVGGWLVGNALFRGIRLADVLREAGIHPDADQLLMTSADGMTIGAPAHTVLDGRDALIAIGMNGEPLPVAHGYPARIVVPGLYGYISACKWVVDIEATRFADRVAYWVKEGWARNPDIKLASRIDKPWDGRTVRAGAATPIAGVAWEQHVGVSKVEVQVNDGPWQRARLATVPSADTWRQWVLSWTPPKPGTYRLRVRATDAAGRVQTSAQEPSFPSGATGLHTITVRAVD